MAIVVGTTLVVGVLLGMVDGGWGFAAWDDAVAEWGSRHATSVSTEVLDWVTDLGSTALLAVIVVAVGTYDAVQRRNLHGMLFLTVVAVGVVAINNLLKWIVDRQRPNVPHLVETSGSSFPSGHASAAAATWLAVVLVITRDRSRRGRFVAAAIAVLISVGVAASRVLLGVHWLTDVIAGLVVGWGWFLLATTLVFSRRGGRGASSSLSSCGSTSADTRAFRRSSSSCSSSARR